MIPLMRNPIPGAEINATTLVALTFGEADEARVALIPPPTHR